MTAAVALKLEPASWLADARDALAAVEGLYNEALASVRARVTKDGKLSNELIEADQHAAHGLAWFATYVQGLKELIDYAERLTAEGAYGETEE
ncbi:MAG: acyl-CoA dehydrogenase, partial [Hyphomicrobiales bacterium]